MKYIWIAFIAVGCTKESYKFNRSLPRAKVSIQLGYDTISCDGVVAFFDDKYAYEVGDEDSYKWTNPDENLAIIPNSTNTSSVDYLPTKMLSICGQPFPIVQDTIHLWLTHLSKKYYKFNFGINSSDITVILNDKLESNTLIKDHFEHGFIPSGSDSLRFSLLIKTN